MPNYKKLVGEKVYLSPVSTDDWQTYDKWNNDDELTYFYYGGRKDVSPAATDSSGLEKHANSKPIFSIIEKEADKLIGECMFNFEDMDNRHAKIGIAIGEKEYWSMGYGSDALRVLLYFGFEIKGFNSICLNVFEYNTRALTCYEKVGFKRQGFWRDCSKRGGKSYGCIYLDMLASEYFANKS